MLGMEYYRKHPDRVASLHFAGAVFDVPAYANHAKALLKTLPESTQRAITKAEAAGQFESPAYENAVNQFYALYVFRKPVQADLDSTFATMNQGIYVYMQGPSEFTITGTFKDYDARSFLPQIKAPTLFTVGEFDEVGPELVKGFADKVPGARYAVMKGAAHVTPWDARDEIVKQTREFLRFADSTVIRR
jgi:proline iminopeptidase